MESLLAVRALHRRKGLIREFIFNQIRARQRFRDGDEWDTR